MLSLQESLQAIPGVHPDPDECGAAGAADHILENVLDRLPDSIRAELAELEVAIDAELQNIFERIDPKKEASQ